jgi:hypothetical protein
MFWSRITGPSNAGCAQANIFVRSGSLAHNCRLRGDAYDPQRPSVLECGGCEGRSTAPLHSRSVRCDELNFRSSTPTFGSTTKLQHIQTLTAEQEEDLRSLRHDHCIPCEINLLGCFDTVGALGVPNRVPLLPVDKLVNDRLRMAAACSVGLSQRAEQNRTQKQ